MASPSSFSFREKTGSMKKIFFSSVLIATVLLGGVLGYLIWKASPLSAQDFLDSGKKYYAQKKLSEATIQFLNAVQKDPRNREARYFLALTYFDLKDITSAAKQLTILLEYFPNDTQANLRLGNIYLSAGSGDSRFFRKAAESAEKILSKEPQNVSALILLGNASAGLQ